MTIRVAVDARVEFGRAGGVQQGIGALARALRALDAADERLTFVTLAGLDDWLRPDLPDTATTWWTTPGRAHAVRVALRGHALGRRVLAAGAAAQRRRGPSASTGCFESLGVDVVHFPTQRAELTTVPFVYQPWDLQHRHLPELFPVAERRRREVHYGAYCRGAAVVVVPTEHVRTDVVAAYDLDPGRVVVIPPWAPRGATVVTVAPGTTAPADDGTDPAGQGAPGAGLEPGVPGTGPGPYVLFPAQAWPHKNHRRLIEAVALLRADGLAVDVVCPGATGDAVDALRRQADRLGVGAQLHFPGYVDDVSVARLYRGARALVFPSLFEGWGYPVVEAMEAGIPVACASGAHLDAAAGDAALRFDPLDPAAIAVAVRTVFLDEVQRAELARRGARHVAGFDWAAIGAAYRAVHRAAAERRPPADVSGRLLEAV